MLALGDHRGKLRHEILDQQIDTVVQSQKNGTNRVDHCLHLRCEVPHNTTVEIFERYINTPGVQLVSLMDHAPGQRQFVNIEKYRTYYQGKYGYNDAQMAEFESQQRSILSAGLRLIVRKFVGNVARVISQWQAMMMQHKLMLKNQKIWAW